MKRSSQVKTQKNKRKPVRKLKWLIPILAAIAFFVIAGGGFLFAAHTEENDAP